MNYQELITKITKSILDNITPYLQDTLKRDKTFKAKVTEIIKDGKVKILYSGKIHTASTTLPCELNDMVRVCVPNGNWQDLYVVENRSKGRTIRDMFNNLNNVTKRVDGMITNGEAAVSCTHEWNGTVLTVTSASGTSSADLKGETGKSAYEYALDGGYTGTEEEFAEKNAQEVYSEAEVDEKFQTIGFSNASSGVYSSVPYSVSTVITTITLEKGSYLIFANLLSSISADCTMLLTFQYDGDSFKTFRGQTIRGNMESGGGISASTFVEVESSGTINLVTYGYYNGNWNANWSWFAIRLS